MQDLNAQVQTLRKQVRAMGVVTVLLALWASYTAVELVTRESGLPREITVDVVNTKLVLVTDPVARRTTQLMPEGLVVDTLPPKGGVHLGVDRDEMPYLRMLWPSSTERQAVLTVDTGPDGRPYAHMADQDGRRIPFDGE